MKIIVAQSPDGSHRGLERYGAALCDVLDGKGHRTQRLDLPSIDEPKSALLNLASFRLLRTDSADALICLDPIAAALRHPRKLVWLLNHSYLDHGGADGSSDAAYLSNALSAAIGEADAIFSPSSFALERLRTISASARLLRPDLPAPSIQYTRNPGSELLLLNPLDDRQRPELLVACLARLPEPFRARWVAPTAQPGAVARLRRLAEDAGVGQRLAIDVRSIDAGEKAYLLAHAAALLELGSNVIAAGESVHDALRQSVPVIAVKDGGALTEIIPSSAPIAGPSGASLAKAVVAACTAPDKKRRGPAKPTKLRETGWTPLVKALTK